MKRTIAYMSAVTALVGVFTAGGLVLGQTGTPAAAAPRPRIAVMNMSKVMKDYNKAAALGKQLMDQSKVYADKLNMLKQKIAALQQDAQKPGVEVKRRDEIEREITRLTREAQDVDAEGAKTIRTSQSDIVVQVYKEIESVVAALARANDLDMVLSYQDAPTEADANTPANVMRKLQSPGTMPIYFRKEAMDLTDAVIQTLNRSYPVPAASATPPQ